VSLSFLGTASAGDTAQFLVVQSGNSGRQIERAGCEIQRELAGGDVLQVAGPEDETELENVGGVQQVVPNAYIGLEGPEFEQEVDEDEFESPAFWGLQWDKQVTDVPAAHDVATGDGSTVAILDTGIDPTHPDLAANVNVGASELFSSGNPIPPADHPWDNYGHGTHVAGTAAATGDLGVIGTAPDAELVSLKVFWLEDPAGHPDEDEPFLTTTLADILAAIDAAASMGADAANMSLGTPPLPPQFNREGFKVAYERVIQDANTRGTVIVASAGNSGANLQQGGYFTTPNSTAGALSVSATAPNDKLVFFSNYGTNEIDIGAPGGGYETLEKTLEEDPSEVAWPYPTNLVLSTYPDGGYAWLAGTSMAAPQVSGTVALIRELAPEANVNKVESALKHGAEGANGRSDAALGAGRLNAANSLDKL